MENQHDHQGIRASGIWQYQPDLRASNAGDLVYASEGVVLGNPEKGFAVRTADPSNPGSVTFRVSAANVATSAKLFLKSSRRTEEDSVTVEVSSTVGITYEAAWQSKGTGLSQAVEIDLQSLVAGATEFLVRVHLSGSGAGLESLRLETLTQINRASLPRLSQGTNGVQLTLGNQAETVQFRPSLVDGNHRATVDEEVLIDLENEIGLYKPILRPAENKTPGHVTWKIGTPTPITAVDYGATVCVKSVKDRVSLLHSWNGKNFVSDFEKRDDFEPWDLVVNRSPESVPPGMKDVFLRYEFATERNKASYSGPGIQMARMRVEHEPRVKGFAPIEVTYCWVEYREKGEVERQHTELVDSPAHEYAINVGGYRDPPMRWIHLKLQETPSTEEAVEYGYSDGAETGSGGKQTRTRYTWGRNLALGCIDTLNGAVNGKNPDSKNDRTDGIVAPPSEDVSEKYMPTNVMFEKDSVAFVTLDLEESQEVAGMRINAGQEIGFHLGFPKTITVETSNDGVNFTMAGTAGHHQVFDPSADFIPWEHDDSPAYARLPAGGRLAFPYRVIFEKPHTARYLRVTCRAQKGWGLLLSEIQAFDTVEIDATVPPLVYLPELKP